MTRPSGWPWKGSALTPGDLRHKRHGPKGLSDLGQSVRRDVFAKATSMASCQWRKEGWNPFCPCWWGCHLRATSTLNALSERCLGEKPSTPPRGVCGLEVQHSMGKKAVLLDPVAPCPCLRQLPPDWTWRGVRGEGEWNFHWRTARVGCL